MNKEKFSFYKEYPKSCSPDDFWGQVKRTVNGEPVSQDQIDMIVDAVVKGLDLNQDDTLLDLCCGNGALSTLFFDYCSGGLGVDFSEYLISIANSNFSDPPGRTYVCRDVVEFCENYETPNIFTKLVCYGSFSYLDKDRGEKLLYLLKIKFPELNRIFIGNCPDKSLLTKFYGDQQNPKGIENDPDTPIGIWRTQKEFISLANNYGWQATISKMPGKYYAAHYRYDVILTNE